MCSATNNRKPNQQAQTNKKNFFFSHNKIKGSIWQDQFYCSNMFWDSGSFYSSPLPYSVYCFSSAWFSSYVEGCLWTSYPYPGQEKGDVATAATPPTRKAVLYQKPLLPPQARCYLHLIGQQFVTFSRCQEIWGSKFIFLASLWKETRRKGVGNCCGSAN